MQELPQVPMTNSEAIVNVVLLVVIVAIIFGLVRLAAWFGPLPGRIAEERTHPHAQAIKIAGWVGLLLMGPLWLAALIWAYVSPSEDRGAGSASGQEV